MIQDAVAVLKGFNSIVVRLKGKGSIVAMNIRKSFNSIVVRLKALWGRALEWGTSEFQFHSGSIKSHDIDQAWPHIAVFQFHSGSIKRMMRWAVLSTRACFNSIVVRLKVPHFPDRTPASWCFNSIVVRLKARRRAMAFIWFAWFQFHSGSIKRKYRPRDLGRWDWFQFHSGSIKRRQTIWDW